MPNPRQCTVCGCCEDHACEGGCSWIKPGVAMCTQCVGWALISSGSQFAGVFNYSLAPVRDLEPLRFPIGNRSALAVRLDMRRCDRETIERLAYIAAPMNNGVAEEFLEHLSREKAVFLLSAATFTFILAAPSLERAAAMAAELSATGAIKNASLYVTAVGVGRRPPPPMSDKAIPEQALAQHTAILGKTGSGKTSTAKLAIEQVVADGFRVCVLDPIKSDWWGLTSSADGKHPGLPFHILGGPHGHVPLHSSTGAAIGELVATGALPLSIIDMADFEPGGLQRFFTDFADALLRSMRGVLYLVIDEAHEFAPKEKSGVGGENMATHLAKKLATARVTFFTSREKGADIANAVACDKPGRFTCLILWIPTEKLAAASAQSPTQGGK